MAVKRSMKKAKAAPIKRSIKRAPAQTDVAIDELPPMVTPEDIMNAGDEAPLTPEQQAEKDALEGSNAAAVANNTTLPAQAQVQMTAQKFKDTVAFKEFMALPIEERKKLIAEDPDVKADVKAYKGPKK